MSIRGFRSDHIDPETCFPWSSVSTTMCPLDIHLFLSARIKQYTSRVELKHKSLKVGASPCPHAKKAREQVCLGLALLPPGTQLGSWKGQEEQTTGPGADLALEINDSDLRNIVVCFLPLWRSVLNWIKCSIRSAIYLETKTSAPSITHAAGQPFRYQVEFWAAGFCLKICVWRPLIGLPRGAVFWFIFHTLLMRSVWVLSLPGLHCQLPVVGILFICAGTKMIKSFSFLHACFYQCFWWYIQLQSGNYRLEWSNSPQSFHSSAESEPQPVLSQPTT